MYMILLSGMPFNRFQQQSPILRSQISAFLRILTMDPPQVPPGTTEIWILQSCSLFSNSLAPASTLLTASQSRLRRGELNQLWASRSVALRGGGQRVFAVPGCTLDVCLEALYANWRCDDT